jgi:6-phosphogluconolactonase
MNGVNVRRGLLGLLAIFTTSLANASFVDKTVVYAMSNENSTNRIFSWYVGDEGNFTPLGVYSTRGQGSGTNEAPLSGPVDGIDPLGSQGSVTISPNGRWLYAVNAGEGSVSVFRVLQSGRLVFASKMNTGGKVPVSVTSNGTWVVVANVNSPGQRYPSNLATFFQSPSGFLTATSTLTPLSGPGARPSQVSFTPDGTQLVVTERETNTIDVFDVHLDGTLGLATTVPSVRTGPFGFGFAGNALVVSEAAPGDPLGSSASSYLFNPPGGASVSVISGGVLNGQLASCWTTINPAGNRAYLSNTVSQTISSYTIGANGALTLREPAIISGASPIDSGINARGRLFFQLLGEKSAIVVYGVDANGDLNFIRIQHTSMPAFGVQGLAVSR